jgi:putative endonuclease
MEGYRKQLGEYGENLASDFLVRRGCQIIDRNFYTNYGEIDLIARQGDELLFVEVKTRTKNNFGYPENAVDWRKLGHLSKTARIWMTSKNINSRWRLDIISVEINKQTKTAKITWFNDLFGY